MTLATLDEIEIFNWAKDTQCRFLSCNENTAKAADEDSPQGMCGKHDTQLIWHDRTESYAITDQLALQGKLIKHYDFLQTINGQRKIIVTKSPLLDSNGKTVGTIGSSIDLTDKLILTKFGYFDDDGNLYFGEKQSNEVFTKYEVRVLRELLTGKSARQISEHLFRSVRTIEGHILAIRRKLQCKTKGDIIYRALELGLIYLCFENIK